MPQSKQKEIIPIFFAVDDNYASLLGVALRSLIDNSSNEYEYNIHILVEDISKENMSRISQMQTDNIIISFVNVSDRLRDVYQRLHLRDYYTQTTYYRFFIPDLFPQFKKGVYLDCDIIINTDIAELYHTELGDNYIAAIPEEFITDVEVFGIYSEKILGVPRNEYVNAGILVMNLEVMRRDGLQQQFATLLEKVTYRVAQDQDYLNVICKNKAVILGKEWNRTPMPYANTADIPQIAHYKINFKPWKFDNIPYGELFWQFAEKTCYYEELWAGKENYSDELKLRDKKQYEDLVRLTLTEINEKEREQEIFDNAMLFAVN